MDNGIAYRTRDLRLRVLREVHHTRQDRVGDRIIGVVVRVGVNGQGDEVVRRPHPGIDVEGRAGVNRRIARDCPDGNVRAVLRRRRKRENFVRHHTGGCPVEPIAAVLPLVGCIEDTDGLVEVAHIVFRHPDHDLILRRSVRGFKDVVIASCRAVLGDRAHLEAQ